MADTGVRVLICYDGSEHAKHAIEGAGKLFPGASAIVVYVTESLTHMLQRYPSPDSFVGDIPFESIDATNAEVGSSIADEGAALATKAGMRAECRCVTSDDSAWNAALVVADEVDADVIVAGDRGRSGVRELGARRIQPALVATQQSPRSGSPRSGARARPAQGSPILKMIRGGCGFPRCHEFTTGSNRAVVPNLAVSSVTPGHSRRVPTAKGYDGGGRWLRSRLWKLQRSLPFSWLVGPPSA